MKILLNESFKTMKQSYLFSEIEARVQKFKGERDGASVISLGIGDVTLPIPSTVAPEMARVAAQMSTKEGFRGYGSSQGDPILRSKIVNYYAKRGVLLQESEIFISDGAKSDLGGLCDILGDNEALICDPVYPVYLDVNLMHGRRTRLLRCDGEDGALPSPNNLPKKPFVIYLCSPNNPTGAVFDRQALSEWVDFALFSGSLIIFDSAYEAFIGKGRVPHSVFEIPRARECAVEVGSFSKMAGFTGIRCGWSVVPSALALHPMWVRRQATKFNGASVISQAGAIAALSDAGLAECRKNIRYYMENAKMISEFLSKKGVWHTGGEHAPYIWLKCPRGEDDWTFFDRLLRERGIVGTPGSGFGEGGKGHFRLSAFASHEDTREALSRLDGVIWK